MECTVSKSPFCSDTYMFLNWKQTLGKQKGRKPAYPNIYATVFQFLSVLASFLNFHYCQ